MQPLINSTMQCRKMNLRHILTFISSKLHLIKKETLMYIYLPLLDLLQGFVVQSKNVDHLWRPEIVGSILSTLFYQHHSLHWKNKQKTTI